MSTTKEPAVDPATGRIPLFNLSGRCQLRTDPDALDAYYADRRRMWWNIIFIGAANIGWGMSLVVVTPLMAVKLLELGVRENIQATMNTANFWAVSFLVMLFSWMSDHTVSRLGRRKPYLFIAAPFIILTIVAFPFLASKEYIWLLLLMQVIYLLFMDLKNSTFALIMIDCMPRRVLARTCSVLNMVSGLIGFLVNWHVGDLLELGEWVPFVLAGAVMAFTTLCACLIREPPVYHPPTEPFKPWSTFQVAARDKRVFFLMIGVAMIGSYATASSLWIWFWSKETLELSRQDIFRAIAWGGLLNVVLAYPMGWVIDRLGGLKVVVTYWMLCAVCFTLFLNVHDKAGLTALVLVQTLVFPLYQAADIMVYKSCPPQEVGSITSTNSCIRNAFIGCLSLVTGWAVYWSGHNYTVGFAIGLGFATLGLSFFLIYSRRMRKGSALTARVLDEADTSITRDQWAPPRVATAND